MRPRHSVDADGKTKYGTVPVVPPDGLKEPSILIARWHRSLPMLMSSLRRQRRARKGWITDSVKPKYCAASLTGRRDWTRRGIEGFLGLRMQPGAHAARGVHALILMGDRCATAQPTSRTKCALNEETERRERSARQAARCHGELSRWLRPASCSPAQRPVSCRWTS